MATSLIRRSTDPLIDLLFSSIRRNNIHCLVQVGLKYHFLSSLGRLLGIKRNFDIFDGCRGVYIGILVFIHTSIPALHMQTGARMHVVTIFIDVKESSSGIELLIAVANHKEAFAGDGNVGVLARCLQRSLSHDLIY